ncbi:MAG: hypothetical protein ACEPOZ_19295 [Marinifilaceae bacterium]|jgi:hypothetical protein
MRNLIYVPIIHSSADLGSMAKTLNRRGVAEFGQEFWQNHIQTIDGFWDAIAYYFETIDLYIKGTKIYQDGMVTDGEIAMKIIEDSIKSGSKNYEIVSDLIQRGAIIVQTEDLELVREELKSLQAITQTKSRTKKILRLISYKLTKGRLLKKRDKYIARRIAETLGENETGILFIGAYHKVKNKLPKDIQIIELKETAKVREYHKLLPLHTRYRDRFMELSQYLVKK